VRRYPEALARAAPVGEADGGKPAIGLGRDIVVERRLAFQYCDLPHSRVSRYARSFYWFLSAI
jgi:hypothetical protein